MVKLQIWSEFKSTNFLSKFMFMYLGFLLSRRSIPQDAQFVALGEKSTFTEMFSKSIFILSFHRSCIIKIPVSVLSCINLCTILSGQLTKIILLQQNLSFSVYLYQDIFYNQLQRVASLTQKLPFSSKIHSTVPNVTHSIRLCFIFLNPRPPSVPFQEISQSSGIG